MVLSATGGGSGDRPGTPPPPPRSGQAARVARDVPGGGERGSQVLEFAMVLPLVGLALGLVLCTGLVGTEMVLAQGVAREAARAAALGSDGEAAEVARAAARRRDVSVRVEPPEGLRAAGDLVTVEVGMRSAVLARFGVTADLRGTATMRAEGP